MEKQFYSHMLKFYTKLWMAVRIISDQTHGKARQLLTSTCLSTGF